MFIPAILGRQRIARGLASGDQRISEASRNQMRSFGSVKLSPQVIYYDKSFIKMLKAKTPFANLASRRPLP